MIWRMKFESLDGLMDLPHSLSLILLNLCLGDSRMDRSPLKTISSIGPLKSPNPVLSLDKSGLRRIQARLKSIKGPILKAWECLCIPSVAAFGTCLCKERIPLSANFCFPEREENQFLLFSIIAMVCSIDFIICFCVLIIIGWVVQAHFSIFFFHNDLFR